MQIIGAFTEEYRKKWALEVLAVEAPLTFLTAADFQGEIAAAAGIAFFDQLSFWQFYRSAAFRGLRQNEHFLIIVFADPQKSEERLRLLENGADLLWSAEVSGNELVQQLKVLMRFLGPLYGETQGLANYRYLTIDRKKKRVFVDQQEVLLTASEYLILSRMAAHEKRIYEREELMTLVSGAEENSTLRVIDTHIKNLRKKIEKNPKLPRYIKTVHGRGYRFEGDD